MSDLSFDGRGLPVVALDFVEDELEISDARFVVKAREVEDEISLALVLEAGFRP